MKKGDKVFYIADKYISESEIQGVRQVILDGVKQPDEYLILPYTLGKESLSKDELFLTIEDAQKAHQAMEIAKAKVSELPIKLPIK